MLNSYIAMNFSWPLIGHQHIKDYFAKAFANGKVNHAYLFEGPKQVGKATFARMLAKTLLCEKYGSSASVAMEAELPCGICRACKAYDNHAHPDVLELDRGESAHISIESAREFITALSTRPLLGRHRIGIIEEAEDFMSAASNALLKTLEEPSKTVVLFLVTSKELLPTIISRCQKIRFNFVSAEEIQKGLEQTMLGKEIAFLSSGRPGLALELQKDGAHREYTQKAQEVFKVLEADESGKFLWATEQFGQRGNLTERRESLLEYLNVCEAILRDCMLLRARINNGALQHIFMQNELSRYAQQTGFSEMTRLIKSITSARQMVYSNVDPRLIAEWVLLDVS